MTRAGRSERFWHGYLRSRQFALPASGTPLRHPVAFSPGLFCAIHPIQRAVGHEILCISFECRNVRAMKGSQFLSFASSGPDRGAGRVDEVGPPCGMRHEVQRGVEVRGATPSVTSHGPVDEDAELVDVVFHRAIGQKSPLSPQERGILLLRVQFAMSMEDVCLALSLSASEYRSAMQEAERKLKVMLAGERAARARLSRGG